MILAVRANILRIGCGGRVPDMGQHVFARVVEVLAIVLVSPGIILAGWALGEFLFVFMVWGDETMPLQIEVEAV